jgi:hypothetical protein
MVSSLEARMFLVEQVFRSATEVQQKSAEIFPDIEVPNRNAVRRLIAKFRETGLVAHLPRAGRLDISDRIL